MAIQNCDVTFKVVNATGQPEIGAIITIWLEDANSMVDGSAVSRGKIRAVTNTNGEATVALIQGAQFNRGGAYIIQISDASGRRLHERRVTAPAQDACNIQQLIEA